MAEKITLDEAKRRRREREMLLPIKGSKPPEEQQHVNGKLREIAVAGWNDLGDTTEAQDNLVAGIIGEQQLAMVYGESGSGKSFLTFDMCAHFALGREWLGHKVKGGGVLYIAAEGRGGWHNRVEAFCRHYQLDEEARAVAPFGFILESVNLGRTGNGDVAAVIRAAERFAQHINQPISLIAIDTMARATPGSNENDAGDMGAFVANVDAIRHATNATQLIVHHSGKNAALGARGHSSLRAAVDCELEVERSDAGRVLRLRKSRDGNDGAEQAFALQVVEIGADAEGQPITSCVVASTELVANAKKGQGRDQQNWQLAMPYLDNTLIDHGENGPRNSKLPNVPMTTVDRFKQALERASIIDGETPGTRRQQWKRIKDKLIAKGILRIDGELCWRADV
jgi:hypothetical protein